MHDKHFSLSKPDPFDCMDPCWNLFDNAIRREATKKNYHKAMERFLKFSRLDRYCDFKELEYDRLKTILSSFVVGWKRQGLVYPSCNNYLSAIELFLEMNEISYPKRVIRKLLPSNDKKQGGRNPYTTDEIKRMLGATTSLRNKALIHFFRSTGARPSTLSDPVPTLGGLVDLSDDCMGIMLYKESKEEYWAFFDPETTQAYNDYKTEREMKGEILDSDSPLFIQKRTYPLTYRNLRKTMDLIIKRAGIKRVKTGQRFDKALFYGFRKRFNTILKINNSVNSNIAEKLMAHKRGLDGTYLQPTREECFNEFRKAIKDLMVDTALIYKSELEQERKEKSELQQQKSQIEQLEKTQQLILSFMKKQNIEFDPLRI